MAALLILSAFVALVVGVVIALYNRLVRLRNRVEQAWADVDVQLRRRHDLIPNLVETVRGYAAHERETFEAVTEARSRAAGARGVQERAQAEDLLSQTLGRLFAVAEQYPQLRADANFRELQLELTRTEDEVTASRAAYNAYVRVYDTAREVVPTNIVASVFGFEEQPYFEVDDPDAREPVEVRF